MVMRRGKHGSRVLETMRVPGVAGDGHEPEVLEPDVTGRERFSE